MRSEVRDKIRAQLSVPGVRSSPPRAVELPASANSGQTSRSEDAQNGGRSGLLRLDVAQRLERLTWDNEQLREDLERERRAHRDSVHAREHVVVQAEHAAQVLQDALETYKQLAGGVGADVSQQVIR